MTGYKLTCPKLHFGQVEHGDIWGSFWSILLVEKATFLKKITKIAYNMNGV